MTTPDQAKEKTVSLEHTGRFRTPDYRVVYSNLCEITVSAWDFQLMFGRGTEVLGETRIEEVATVFISPTQAKSLITVLKGQIDVYESRFGEIKIEPKMTAPMNVEEPEKD
jgi:hypothetical protein